MAAEVTGQKNATDSGAGSGLYQAYLAQHKNSAAGTGSVTIKADQFDSANKAVKAQLYEGKDNVVLLDESSGELTYTFDVDADGRYRIQALYAMIAKDSALDINLSFKLDGAAPFEEAGTVFLSKTYVNETAIKTDAAGNDVRPNQIEYPEWRTAYFIDNSGYNPDAFELFLTKGRHKLTIAVTQEAVALAELKVVAAEELPSYQEVEQGYSQKGYAQAKGEKQELQAELADKKSNSSIYAYNMRSNAAVEPSDPFHQKLNVISAGKQGEWMSWTVSVKESGLYRLGFRVLQDQNRGMVSTWRLYIDGSVPFQEANSIEFPYSISWYNHILGGEKDPYLFYLEAGKEHTITLECTTGKFAETLSVVRSVVYDLNVICRKLTMVTGISPDMYRDYNFDAEIPDLKESLISVRDTLQAELDRLNNQADYTGSELVALEDILRQVKNFIADQRSIPARLSNFRTDISSLGTWMLKMTSQTIVLDSVAVLTKDSAMNKANANVVEQLAYDFKSIVGSFIHDYNNIAGDSASSESSITVWVSAGRDQANLIRRIVDSGFTPKSNVTVNLSLVPDSTTLLQATLANKGPDIALFVEKTLPVNLAARGALCELSGFDGFEEVSERFYASAFIPYRFNGGVYAIPNSQGFNVLFVRTDIFQELGIKVPGTWEEFHKVLPIIQRRNMQVGALADQSIIFETLILQHGGQFYKTDLTATDFGSKNVLDAFKMWTGFYTEYSLPLAYDAFSYFRSGIMPMMIADYTQYNQLVVAAPEIKGLWSIYPIPGIKNDDQTVNRAESATGTAAIIMKSAKDKQAAFKFLDWWTTTKTQTEYSRELEMTMGPAARYNSANIETLGNLSWKKHEFETIREQWKSVSDIPSIPSSYYVTRNVANAFRSVVYNDANERETLNKYSEIIDKEIVRKNKELGISR